MQQILSSVSSPTESLFQQGSQSSELFNFVVYSRKRKYNSMTMIEKYEAIDDDVPDMVPISSSLNIPWILSNVPWCSSPLMPRTLTNIWYSSIILIHGLTKSDLKLGPLAKKTVLMSGNDPLINFHYYYYWYSLRISIYLPHMLQQLDWYHPSHGFLHFQPWKWEQLRSKVINWYYTFS